MEQHKPGLSKKKLLEGDRVQHNASTLVLFTKPIRCKRKGHVNEDLKEIERI